MSNQSTVDMLQSSICDEHIVIKNRSGNEVHLDKKKLKKAFRWCESEISLDSKLSKDIRFALTGSCLDRTFVLAGKHLPK